MKLRLIAVICLILSGCANPYAKFYQDKTGGEDLTRSPRVILSSDKPEQFRGNDQDADDIRMHEDGFGLIGVSAFNGPDTSAVDISKMLAQAEKVHASAVLIYPPKYAGVGGGSLGGSYYPTYHYFASYWIKLKPPVFGVYVGELSAELKEKIGSDKGVVVVAVIKNSPAASVDIVRGDVLRQIGEEEIIDKATLNKALSQYAGKKVTVKYLHDGKEITKEVVFNERT